jgi:hypothetical protein
MCRQYLELWAADERASASSASTDGPPLDTDDNDDDQVARRFDPKPWLWQLLSDREWRTFAESLRNELTEMEILELVWWGKAIPESTLGKYLAAPF